MPALMSVVFLLGLQGCSCGRRAHLPPTTATMRNNNNDKFKPAGNKIPVKGESISLCHTLSLSCVLYVPLPPKKGRKWQRASSPFSSVVVYATQARKAASSRVASIATREEEGEDVFHTQPFRAKQSRNFATKKALSPTQTKSRPHSFGDGYEKEVYVK